MSTQTFAISANEAERAARTEQLRMNNGRTIPPIPLQIKKLAEDTKVWIYNVGPWGYKRELGSAGTYFIPKCEENQEYATMNPIPGVFHEYVIRDETAFESRFEDGDEIHGGTSGGRYIASQIVGVGRMLSPGESLIRYGVFIGSQVGPNAKPTKQELSDAKAVLSQTADTLVNEADKAERIGPKELEQTLTDKHHWAAAYRKLDAREHRWMRENVSSIVGRQTCPVDGTVSDGNVIMCPTCKYLFNEEKYKTLQNRMAK